MSPKTNHPGKVVSAITTATLTAVFSFSSSHAATITGVTIEDVSSELGAPFNRPATGTISGGAGYIAGSTNTHTVAPDGGDMWLNKGVFQAPNDPLPAVITFDLEANYDLSSMTIWNYNEAGRFTGRGANNVEVLVASTVGGSFTSLGNFTFARAPGNSSTPFGDHHALTAAAADDTRLVRFNITSNHGGDNQFIGLSEVRFDGIIPIPEPSTTALLGLGGLAVILRRRK